MRYDMNKVLTERTRYGGNRGNRGTYDNKSLPREKRSFKGADVDLRPKHESMRRKHEVNDNSKEFSDLLGPLVRYLFSKVGSPWDDVWSDICKVLRGNGLQADHVKGHVKQMVGGIPHSGECSFRDEEWFSPASVRYGQGVYVNEDGILCKDTGKSAKRSKTVYHYYRESDTVEYHKLNGCWFWVEIGSYEAEREYPGYLRTYTRTETHYVVKTKKALSKKAAKRLGLDNKTETVAPKLVLEKAS